MRNLSRLKSTLEELCKIAYWNPTASHLEKIADKLARIKPTSVADVTSIIIDVYPNTTFLCLEGVDNSDIRTLLALAIQVANTKS